MPRLALEAAQLHDGMGTLIAEWSQAMDVEAWLEAYRLARDIETLSVKIVGLSSYAFLSKTLASGVDAG